MPIAHKEKKQHEKKREMIDVSEARSSFADLVSRVAFGHDRVVLCRNGKKVAAVLSFEDLEFLERLEDERDVRDALAAHEKGKFYTSEQAKKRLGIK
jgi:prevent-host-death family protein